MCRDSGLLYPITTLSDEEDLTMTSGGMSSTQKGFMYLQLKQAKEAQRLAEERYSEEERKQIEEARARARRGAKGRSQTLLTGGMGVLEAPSVKKQKLGE